MSQVELARATGLTPKHISQMATGRIMGTLATWDYLLLMVGRRDAVMGSGE